MADADGGRREIRDLQIENLRAVLHWHYVNPPKDEAWMYGEETEAGPGHPDNLDRFFETLDDDDVGEHPLDRKPLVIYGNQVVLEAFWQLNGFRDGMGGAIMPSVIEWWIEKERWRLIPANVVDVRDLVPVCDVHWRSLKQATEEEEREERESRRPGGGK